MAGVAGNPDDFGGKGVCVEVVGVGGEGDPEVMGVAVEFGGVVGVWVVWVVVAEVDVSGHEYPPGFMCSCHPLCRGGGTPSTFYSNSYSIVRCEENPHQNKKV
ncbi:hypothetical protein CS176_2222 [Corynebacterium glutamicum]|nr:hypothetical protein CS176_2222 [Corynebacterium glutamicum]